MPGSNGAYEDRRRVLVVDEESIVLDFIATVLARAGYGALGTRNPTDALSLFYRHAPELALMVFDIATVGGWEFIDNLPTRNPRIPVILMSGLGEYEEPQALTSDFPVLRKPFHPSDLKIRIRTLALPNGPV